MYVIQGDPNNAPLYENVVFNCRLIPLLTEKVGNFFWSTLYCKSCSEQNAVRMSFGCQKSVLYRAPKEPALCNLKFSCLPGNIHNVAPGTGNW